MATTYLLLGTNLGNRFQHLKDAQEQLLKSVGRINSASNIYNTAAWGKENQNDYLNQVLEIETTLSPETLLATILHIEQALGRKRKITWEPRIIDIDILFYEQHICASEKLTIPHPFIPKRRFVLTPLAEIIPNFVHPFLKKTISQLLEECPDKLRVEKMIPSTSV